MPAGTGVCVVNTPPARTASTASANVRPTGDVLADALEREEAGVTLVRVEHLRVQTECAQRAHAADAEHDLLAQAVLDVAAVEPVGDAGGLRAVGVGRRCRAGTAGSGRRRRCQIATGDVLAADLEADLQPGRRHRQPVRVLRGEALVLPAVGVEALAEVALGGRAGRCRRAARRDRPPPSGGRRRGCRGRPSTAASVSLKAELGREVGDELERRCRRGCWNQRGSVVASSQPRRRPRRPRRRSPRRRASDRPALGA